MKRLIGTALASIALTFAMAATALADAPTPAPPAVTDNVTPGKACAHANLVANRNFDANHVTGVKGAGNGANGAANGNGGGGTPPTCPERRPPDQQ